MYTYIINVVSKLIQRLRRMLSTRHFWPLQGEDSAVPKLCLSYQVMKMSIIIACEIYAGE